MESWWRTGNSGSQPRRRRRRTGNTSTLLTTRALIVASVAVGLLSWVVEGDPEPNPYGVLGVSRSASKDEIKRAYKKLAATHHPDKKGGSHEEFMRVSHAYETLSDPEKKRNYDQYGVSDPKNAQRGRSGGGGGFGRGWGVRNRRQRVPPIVSNTVPVTYSNYNSIVLDDGTLWLLEFYTDWCGSCREMSPKWDKAAEGLRGIARLGRVNGDESPWLVRQFSVRNYPTIIAVRNGDVTRMRGSVRSSADIKSFAAEFFTSHVTFLDDVSFGGWVNEHGDRVKAVLFSRRKSVSVAYKALSEEFSDTVAFAQMSATSKKARQTMDKYGVGESPCLVFIREDADKGEIYVGSLAFPALSSYMRKNQFLAVPRLTPHNVHALCGPTHENSRFGVNPPCLIFFASAGGKRSLRDELASLRLADAGYKEAVAAGATTSGTVQFTWIDCDTQAVLCSAYKAEPDATPAMGRRVVVVNTYKSKYETYKGPVDGPALVDWLAALDTDGMRKRMKVKDLILSRETWRVFDLLPTGIISSIFSLVKSLSSTLMFILFIYFFFCRNVTVRVG